VAVAVVMLDLIYAGLDSHWAEEADENVELFVQLDDPASSCFGIIIMIMIIIIAIEVGDWRH
jgi:hypothetical protein